MAQINSLDSKIESRIQNVTQSINNHDDAMERRIGAIDTAILQLIANVPNRAPSPSPPVTVVIEERD